MANQDVEVEIKVPLGEREFAEVREKLGNIARLEKKTEQSDEYFNPPHKDFLAPEFPFEWLSIRKRGDKAILNYKHWYPENTGEATHCDEFETEISKPEKLTKLFSALGFKPIVTVEKQRETWVCGDEFEIALDTVKDLGWFIEVEALKDFGGPEKTRERILEFAKSLGVDTSNEDFRGYPFLLLEKRGIIIPK